MNFERIIFSVSLDFINEAEHDAFRGFDGAFRGAINALSTIVQRNNKNFVASLRATVAPDKINEVETIVAFARKLGVPRMRLSSIYPSGRAQQKSNLWMNKFQKKEFLELIRSLQQKYRGEIDISTSDPLKWITREPVQVNDNRTYFNGCPAGTVCFNVFPNGNLTPCSLFQLPILNILNLSIDEIASAYGSSPIVHDLFDRNLSGKCGQCPQRVECAGCRVRAYGVYGDYLAEDPDCWLS